ncbi:MAG: ABC transporter substrate-binding protein [Halobacteria archaeon]
MGTDSGRRRFMKKMGVAGIGVTVGLSGCMSGGGFDGDVTLGAILPMSGGMKAYGPGIKTGIEMAVEDVNNGGGMNGKKVSVEYKDSGTDADKGLKAFNSLVSEEGIPGFVGAGSSGVSSELAKKAGEEKVMEVSPASTSPVLENMGYNGDVKYFGRTAPNDGLQGLVMSQVLNKRKFIGAAKAGFIYVDNPYGKGLAEEASQTFVGETTSMTGYDPKTVNHDEVVKKTLEGNPDAVVIVAYPENGRKFIDSSAMEGYDGGLVLSESMNSDSNFLNPLGSKLDGSYMVSPDPKKTRGSKKFRERVEGGEVSLFSEASYDALVLMAMAAEKAGENTGTGIAKNIKSVSRPPGEKITVGEYGKARRLIRDEKEVNYQGASGAVDLDDNIEPLSPFAIYQIEKGNLEKLKHVPVNENF